MESKLTYKEAGVDTREAAALVGDIGKEVARTQQARKLFGAFGLFAAAYDLSDYKEPVLVTGCDGVGTKLELLFEYDLVEWAGMDLVAMSVNDILTTGGDPLLFLDYIGVDSLDKPKITRLIKGMSDYLEACKCILAGGETAEMPGLVGEGNLELAGFCIGCVEKPELIVPDSLEEGDVLIGYQSDGIHANGWSLVRRVLQQNPDLFSAEEMKEILKPTRLYHDVVWGLRDAGIKPKAMAHITGGGLPENLERVIGELGADIKLPDWDAKGLEKLADIVDLADLPNTFNLGFGWVIIVPKSQVEAACAAGCGGVVIGELDSTGEVKVDWKFA